MCTTAELIKFSIGKGLKMGQMPIQTHTLFSPLPFQTFTVYTFASVKTPYLGKQNVFDQLNLNRQKR